MNIKQLREQLEIDEGVKYEIYKDHLGYPTFGIGHLIVKGDPEYGKPIGTKISLERVVEAFNQDVCQVLGDCEKLYPDFYELPEEAQQIIANMMFNMGLTRLSKFVGMKRGVDARHWMLAADEMVDSKWWREFDRIGSKRAVRLVKRMRNI